MSANQNDGGLVFKLVFTVIFLGLFVVLPTWAMKHAHELRANLTEASNYEDLGQKTFVPARIESFKVRVVGNVNNCRKDHYSSECVDAHENVKLIFEDNDEGIYSFPEYSYNAEQADQMIHSSAIRLRKVFIDKTG